MKLLDRLFRPASDPYAEARPLWLAVVGEARQPRWYAELGVADSVEGRFDMVTLVLGQVLLRLEREPDPNQLWADLGVRLTELFVEDMDAQLRQSGVGDLMVGKHMGKLMAVLGGRIGALRGALASEDGAALDDVVARNARMLDGAGPQALAAELRRLEARLAGIGIERLLAGGLTA